MANFFVFVVYEVDVSAGAQVESGPADVREALVRPSQSGAYRIGPKVILAELELGQIRGLLAAVNLRRWATDLRGWL